MICAFVVDHDRRCGDSGRRRWPRRATSTPRCGSEPGTFMRPNMPGCSTPSLLSKRARTRIVPVAWSSRFSAKSSLPLNGRPRRSARRTVTSRPPAPSCIEPPRVAGVAGIGEVGALIDVEIEVDRIDRDDRGQQGLVRLHEIADRDQAAVDAAGQRRLDLGEFEVEAGPPQRRLRALVLGLRSQGIRGGGRRDSIPTDSRFSSVARRGPTAPWRIRAALLVTSTCDRAASSAAWY